MSKNDQAVLPDINALIIEKLKLYPPAISEMAIKSIQLSEDLPEATVFETLQTFVRDVARRHGGDL